MKIGLIDVDGHNFPNLALMKLSSYHKKKGDEVEWYNALEEHYDVVYMSKVFTHKPDYNVAITNATRIVKGGTGYDVESKLPEEAEKITPDYELYPFIDKKTAYGFLTRGCIRKCTWCIVPRKEGSITPYQDVEEIAIDGRTNLILMDNNILAAGEYGLEQLRKIRDKGYRIDFNQAMDARLVDDEIAELLANIKWINYIKFGCDTPPQIKDCEQAIRRIQSYGYKGSFFLFTILRGDINECHNRVKHWKDERFDGKVKPFAQPELNFEKTTQIIPQWQKEMAHWANKKTCYFGCDFEDFEPRVGFFCGTYFGEYTPKQSKDTFEGDIKQLTLF